ISACSLFQQTVQVPGPTVYVTKHDTVTLSGPPIYIEHWDTVKTHDTSGIPVHDTVVNTRVIIRTDSFLIGIPTDTVDLLELRVPAVKGDSYPALQAAINYCQANSIPVL